jgi:sugar lactone lactonase YvrE
LSSYLLPTLPNAWVAINQPDVLLITDDKTGLVSLDIHAGKVTPFLARRNTESFKGVNDLTIAKNGDIYFTDQGQSEHLLHRFQQWAHPYGADGGGGGAKLPYRALATPPTPPPTR